MNKPTIQQCHEYCNNLEQSIAFHAYFESIDWMVGSKGNAKPMQKWKGALTGWVNRHKSKPVSKVDTALANASTRLTDRLWKRFTEIYGCKWTSNYGAEPTQPWIDAIERLPGEDIKRGLNQVLKNGDNWPVSLVKFISLCRANKSRLPNVKTLPYKSVQQLREDTQHIRVNEMDKIRAIL